MLGNLLFKCKFISILVIGSLIIGDRAKSELIKDNGGEGFMNRVPMTAADAFVDFQKEHQNEEAKSRRTRDTMDVLKYLNFGADFFQQSSKRSKRDIFQLPSILYSKNISQECVAGFLMAIPALGDIFFGLIPFWPLHLLDSAGKSAIGSLRGTRRKRGNFHGCINIQAQTPLLLQSFMTLPSYIGKFCHIIGEYGSEHIVYHMENEVIPPKITRRQLDTEICFPSLCTDKDVVNIVETFSNELVYDEFEIVYMKCTTADKGRLSAWTITVIVLCSIWGIVLLIGSAFDLLQEFVQSRKKQNWLDPNKPIDSTVHSPPVYGRMARILMSFSIPRNFGYLLDNPHDYSPEEVIPCIGGLRFYSFFWAQIFTIYLVAIKLPWGNYAGMLEDLRTVSFQWVINGRFAAETTFCIGGFLSCYGTMKAITRSGGQFNFLRYYWRRYLRIVPPYVLVMILTTAFFWYSFDEGPEWVTKYQFEHACRKHWWKGLFFINNFFSDAEECPPISWYFAVDMQLHLMAPFVIYILYNKPRVGIWLILLLTVLFSSISALMTAAQHLPFFIGRLFYYEENHQQYLDLIIQMPYSHAGPFLIGMLYGYMLFIKGGKAKLNKSIVLSAWLTSISIILLTIYGFYSYIDGREKMPMVLGLLYTILAPSLWSLAIGWIIYACATGYGPGINNLLTFNIFSNFNRLSYCCYLSQALAIKHFLFSRPDPLYYEPWMMLLIVNGSTMMAIFGGIAISVVIERPCLELEKALSYKPIEEQTVHLADDYTEEEDEVGGNV